MYKALIDSQSLVNPEFLNNYDVVDTYEEYWPGEDPDVLHMSKIRIPEDKLDIFIESLSSKGIDEGWFTLVWNDNEAIVVLKNKIFKLKNIDPWNEKELSDLIDYGKEHEIDKKYFLNMRSVMKAW
jgi:hypothetical protein